ncbi:hypothetical protein O1432_17600 [Bacteroides fragilis]|uniref:lanthionine synthetase LanC family protein n=1 Tax=Bacteroides TaxID=816 RepID=UPI001C3904EB|nr:MULTISPECIES: lanthionine synthetase LanC family protein [Bacteroides]MBV4192445.1 hypothetical protein [Bacteroides fragilis]MCZ2617435.1 hypothetical protein [Bacteroides fragilis]MCZ2625921.1 hypothetical protein [Bacteroides fragilis]MDV6206166.1 lanthionine synthetase LanC family protein [Bacteroides hominis (ex Liu et al. 2022)]
MGKVDEALLKRIADHQMLHGSFRRDLGVLNGKMGIVLFFFHYARYTGRVLYEDFAGEMLEEVIQELHSDLPIRFSDGLCGIGWGVEYLIQNAFIAGDSDEILEDLDQKIMEWDPRRATDLSFESGLEGVACYVSSRLKSTVRNRMPFDQVYLSELEMAVQQKGLRMRLELDDIFVRVIDTGNIEEEVSWKYGLKMIAL